MNRASLLVFLLASTAAAQPDVDCVKEYARLWAPADVSAVLGRFVSKKQMEALDQVNREAKEFYTPRDLVQQEKTLKAAGFSNEDIRKLRQKHLLARIATSRTAQAAPDTAEVIQRKLRPIDRNFFDEIGQSRREFHYVVDHQNQIFLVEGDRLGSDKLWLIRDPDTQESPLHIVKESGTVSKSESGEILFRPQYSIDATKMDAEEALKKLEDSHAPGSRIARASTLANEQAQVLNCMDILAKRTAMSSGIFDRMIADNMVVTSAFLVTELAGAKRMESVDGQQVILSDLIGTNINSVVSATLGSYLVSSNRSLPVSLLARTGTALGMIEVQRGVYKMVLDKDAEERADKIALFDQLYFMARLPVSHYTDKFIMKRLPEMLYDSCRKGSKLSVFITPRSVRIMERYGMTIFYYGARSAIIGE